MTQNEMILAYLKEHGSITQLSALRDLGVMRLASRISDLRKKGIKIEDRAEVVKTRYGGETRIKRYRLAEEESWKEDMLRTFLGSRASGGKI